MGQGSAGSSRPRKGWLRVWPFWVCRFLIFAIPIGVLAWLMPAADRGPFIVVAVVIILVTSYARHRALSSLVARALLVLGVSVIAIVVLRFAAQWFAGAGWLWSAGLALMLIVVIALRREVGSLSPRFIGVPRPDASDEPVNPLEGTSDDAVPLVDALDSLWGSTRPGGPRIGLRAVHSHGSGATGRFLVDTAGSAPEALGDREIAWWSIPLLRDHTSLAAVARFSNFSGTKHRDDSLRAPHGLAVRLTAPSGADGAQAAAGIDLVLVDIRRFPVSNRDDFFGFIRRYGRWLRFALFWLVDRTSLLALKGMVPLARPSSYATRTYHSLNTFIWMGEPVRYRLVPCQWRSVPAPGDRRSRLDRDLRSRLRTPEGVQFELDLVRGQGLPDSVLYDARRCWPRWGMPYSRLGTLKLTTFVEQDEITSTAFDPHRLPEGVEPSRDEILMARRAAYPESHLRRCPVT